MTQKHNFESVSRHFSKNFLFLFFRFCFTKKSTFGKLFYVLLWFDWQIDSNCESEKSELNTLFSFACEGQKCQTEKKMIEFAWQPRPLGIKFLLQIYDWNKNCLHSVLHSFLSIGNFDWECWCFDFERHSKERWLELLGKNWLDGKFGAKKFLSFWVKPTNYIPQSGLLNLLYTETFHVK